MFLYINMFSFFVGIIERVEKLRRDDGAFLLDNKVLSGHCPAHCPSSHTILRYYLNRYKHLYGQ